MGKSKSVIQIPFCLADYFVCEHAELFVKKIEAVGRFEAKAYLEEKSVYSYTMMQLEKARRKLSRYLEKFEGFAAVGEEIGVVFGISCDDGGLYVIIDILGADEEKNFLNQSWFEYFRYEYFPAFFSNKKPIPFEKC